MARGLLLAGFAAAWSAAVAAQTDITAIHIQNVRGNLYVITGGRGSGGTASTISGNTTVYVADSGVVLVDTKLPNFGQPILDAVKSVTSKPVTTIINTHTHNDHTGSNNELPRGVAIVAHQNTKSNMEKMDPFKGANASGLPTRTFTDRMTLFGGPDRIDLYYFGAGHTNGDIVIVFPALRTAVMGDLFARKWAPLVDAGNGGSATAFPETLAKALAGIKDVDNVIMGHSTRTVRGATTTFVASGPVVPWRDLQEYAQFTRAFVAAAEAAMKAGKTVDEALAGLKLPDTFKDYDMNNARDDIQRVYEETKAP